MVYVFFLLFFIFDNVYLCSILMQEVSGYNGVIMVQG